jgi:O-antigen ligase
MLLQDRLEKLSRFFIYIIPIIPLLFIDGFFYPFVFSRTLFFRLVILLLASLSSFLFFKNLLKYKFKFDLLYLLFSLFLLVLTISSIFGLDFYKSLLSTFERMEGLVYWYCLFLFLVYLKLFLYKKEHWVYFWRINIFVSFLVFIYGLIQKYSILPLFHSGLDRVESTLGNAAFLGSYALLILGISVFLFFFDKYWKYRYLYLFSAFLNLALILWSGTRSSLLALIIGLVLSAIFFAKKTQKIIFGFLLSILITLAAFFVFDSNLFNIKPYFVDKINAIVVSDASIYNRIFVWQNSLKEFENVNIIFGVGLENFDVFFNRFYTPDINEDWFDRSHNIFLDVLVTSGILGLLIYLSIILVLLRKIWQYKDNNYIAFLVLFFLIIAYSINNFFVFDTINTAFIFVSILAFVSFLISQDNLYIDQKLNKKIANIILVLLSLVLICCLYFFIYHPFYINKKLYKGFSHISVNKELAYSSFSDALRYKFASNEGAIQLESALNNIKTNNLSPENLSRFVRLAEDKFWFANRNYPLDIRINLHLAQLIINYHNDNEGLAGAEKILIDAKNLSPYRAETYYLLAQVYIKQENFEKAVDILEELSSKLPDFADSKFILANILHTLDLDLSNKYFYEAISMPYAENVLNYQRILEFLVINKKYDEALPFYLKLIEDQPNEFKYRIDLAQVYYILGDFDKAVEQISIVKLNSPEVLDNFQDIVNMILKED